MLAVDSLPGSVSYARSSQIFKKEQQAPANNGREINNTEKSTKRSNGPNVRPTQPLRRTRSSPEEETITTVRCRTPSRKKSDKTKQLCKVKLPKITPTAAAAGTRQLSKPNGNVSVPFGGRKSSTELRLSVHTYSSQLKSKQSNVNSKGRNGALSRSNDNPKATKRKGKSPYIIYAIMPNNLLEEKRKFFASGYKCNPVFEYDTPADELTLARYSHASYTLLPQVGYIL